MLFRSEKLVETLHALFCPDGAPIATTKSARHDTPALLGPLLGAAVFARVGAEAPEAPPENP